jgi:hypothetical protein
MTDEEALRKARLLKTLVEKGATEGERAAAKSVLEKLLLKYPNVRAPLDAPEPPEAVPPPPPPWAGAWGVPPRPAASGFKASGKAEPPKPTGFMGDVWAFLRDAATSLREGMTLRERVRDITAIETSINTRTFSMRLSIPVRDLEDLLEELGPEMDEALATVVASLVREEFLTVLASMDTEDVDE